MDVPYIGVAVFININYFMEQFINPLAFCSYCWNNRNTEQFAELFNIEQGS